MANIYEILAELGIEYEKYEHPAVYTCEESEQYTGNLEGAKDKNLFLRNKKGKKHYLVSVESHKRVNLKSLAQALGESALTFASPERLKKYLNLIPGSVTPFGLINDQNKEVDIIIDEDLMKHDKIQFHPDSNTSTIIVKTEDFKKFLEWTGNNFRYIKL